MTFHDFSILRFFMFSLYNFSILRHIYRLVVKGWVQLISKLFFHSIAERFFMKMFTSFVYSWHNISLSRHAGCTLAWCSGERGTKKVGANTQESINHFVWCVTTKFGFRGGHCFCCWRQIQEVISFFLFAKNFYTIDCLVGKVKTYKINYTML